MLKLCNIRVVEWGFGAFTAAGHDDSYTVRTTTQEPLTLRETRGLLAVANRAPVLICEAIISARHFPLTVRGSCSYFYNKCPVQDTVFFSGRVSLFDSSTSIEKNLHSFVSPHEFATDIDYPEIIGDSLYQAQTSASAIIFRYKHHCTSTQSASQNKRTVSWSNSQPS